MFQFMLGSPQPSFIITTKLKEGCEKISADVATKIYPFLPFQMTKVNCLNLFSLKTSKIL